MELTPEIRQRLKNLMESKQDTGYTLNKKLGISATTISNYLNGKITKADNQKIKAMCDLWGVDMAWLETGVHKVEQPEETESETSLEEVLKQILIRLNSQDEQYNNLRHEVLLIRDNLHTIYKNQNMLLKEIQEIKANTKQEK